MTTREEYFDLADKLHTPTGEAALKYAAAGLAVYAPAWGAKVPNKGTSGIEGRTSATATRDANTLFDIYTEKPNNNVAIRLKLCDPPIVSIDTDSAAGHPTAEERETGIPGVDGSTVFHDWYWHKYLEMPPETWTIRTATGGLNYLFRLPEGKTAPKNVISALTRVDFLGDGNGQMMPPSYRKDVNAFYTWEPGLSPDDIELATIPDCLLEFWEGLADKAAAEGNASRRAKNRAKTIADTEHGIIPSGARNTTLFKYARALVVEGVHDEELAERVHRVNLERCDDPLPDTEVDTIIDSAINYGGGRAKGTAPTQSEIVSFIQNDGALFGRFGQNVLDGGYYVMGALPWSIDASPLSGFGGVYPAGADGYVFNTYRRWNETDAANLFSYVQDATGTRNRKDVRGAFMIVAGKNQFNPIVDMLNTLPAWDGETRADFMLWALFGAEDNEYTREASRIWMHGAVRRAFEPGCKFDLTLVLKGAQGIKKSMTGRYLAMREEFFCETVTDITNAKTTAEQIGGKWIVELGELNGIKGKQLEAVKAALTRQKETLRHAWGEFAVDQYRSCVFFATTNEEMFLTDPTGNRRFLPVECNVVEDRDGFEHASIKEKRGFIIQAWAEVVERYKEARRAAGDDEDKFLELFPMMLSEQGEALAEEQREKVIEEDTRIGIIGEWLQYVASQGNTRYICTRMIAEEALEVPKDKLMGASGTRLMKDIGQILKTNYPEWVKQDKKARCGIYGIQWVYALSDMD